MTPSNILVFSGEGFYSNHASFKISNLKHFKITGIEDEKMMNLEGFGTRIYGLFICTRIFKLCLLISKQRPPSVTHQHYLAAKMTRSELNSPISGLSAVFTAKCLCGVPLDTRDLNGIALIENLRQ